MFCKTQRGSLAQASPPPTHLCHVTRQYRESTTFPYLLDSNPFETYTYLSGTEGDDISIKEVLGNPHRLQGRANQETN